MNAEQFAQECLNYYNLGYEKVYLCPDFSFISVSPAENYIPIDVSSCKATKEQYIEIFNFEKSDFRKQQRLLEQVPVEFRAALSYMAYERGHSAGDAEITIVLADLVDGLKKPIKEFENRIEREVIHFQNL